MRNIVCHVIVNGDGRFLFHSYDPLVDCATDRSVHDFIDNFDLAIKFSRRKDAENAIKSLPTYYELDGNTEKPKDWVKVCDVVVEC